MGGVVGAGGGEVEVDAASDGAEEGWASRNCWKTAWIWMASSLRTSCQLLHPLEDATKGRTGWER